MRPIAVDLALTTRGGGLLDLSGSLPSGWVRGVSFLDEACLTPTVLGECPQVSGLTDAQRPGVATFLPVSLVNAVVCSTMGGVSVADIAAVSSGQTADFALAREMLTAEASERDANAGGAAGPNPSLVGTAFDLGATHTSIAKQVACLEMNLAIHTAGRPSVLLAGPDWLTQAAAAQVIRWDGSAWRTPYGSLVIPSAGFDGRAPDSVAPPNPGAALYVYGVPAVWAETGPAELLGFVTRSVNDQYARTDTMALAAFSTCAVYAAASTAATAC